MQGKLQQRIDADLAVFADSINKESFLRMMDVVKSNFRFNWTCLVVSIRDNTMSIDMPCDFDDMDLGGDTRRSLFRDMLLALDVWCARHGLAMPEADFVISVRDTYVWEKHLSNLPWMVVAKPRNRNGILIPDSSFLSHDMSNHHKTHSNKPAKQTVLAGKHDLDTKQRFETPALWRSKTHHLAANTKNESSNESSNESNESSNESNESNESRNESNESSNETRDEYCVEEDVFLWDEMKQTLAAKSESVVKQDVVFFKGADTTSDKCACRSLLHKANKAFLEIDLLGSKQPMYVWAAKKFLLNLPGHQPWSYRRKYLYLLRSVVFHVDVVTHFSEEDVSLGWELFFDRLFEEQTDFLRFELHAFDHNVPNYQDLNSKAFTKLLSDIQEAYQSKLIASCVVASCLLCLLCHSSYALCLKLLRADQSVLCTPCLPTRCDSRGLC